jgi:hypothetical protein
MVLKEQFNLLESINFELYFLVLHPVARNITITQ